MPRATHPTAIKSITSVKNAETYNDQSTNPLKRKREELSKRGDDQPTNSLKRKAEELLKGKADDTKLNEYLGLMTAPSKMKTWRDGELPMLQDPTAKTKDSTDHAKMGEKTTAGQEVVSDDSADKSIKQDEALQKVQNTSTSIDADEVILKTDTQSPSAGATDLDWMRSRTSRLLSLVEDDEDENTASTQAKLNSPIVPDEASKYGSQVIDDQAESGERSEQVHTSAMPATETLTEEAVTADVAAIKASGRLFLRNLAYSVTEEELRTCFSPFGTLEEVSSNHFVSYCATSKDELPDRDNLCILHDVNLVKRILVDASSILNPTSQAL